MFNELGSSGVSSRGGVFDILAAPFSTAAHARPLERFKKRVFESDLLDPYEKLITIEVLGERVEVPERNRLLRCFQFLSIETISYGDFCWNGDCTNCQFWYHYEGEADAPDRTALSCRFDVREGLVVTRLSPHIEIEGVNKRNDECGVMNDELKA